MIADPLTKQLALWRTGLKSEVDFWDGWFNEKGGMWPEDFTKRLKEDTEIESYLIDGLQLDGRLPKILDIGAGPMSIVGKCLHGQKLDITAADPLAPYYSEIARRTKVERPIVTQQAFSEDLSSFFDAGSFDLVFCSNSLDHSFEPVRGIEEMLLVAGAKGRIVLVHGVNEAEHCQYGDLHQWNFCEEGGDFIIWSKHARMNVSEMFRPYAKIRCWSQPEGRSVTAIFDKIGELPIDVAERRRIRTRELLSALLGVFMEGDSAGSEPHSA